MSINESGSVKVGAVKTYTQEFSGGVRERFFLAVSWRGKVTFSPPTAKDLALHVTAPNGDEWVIDRENTTSESFWMGPDLASGTYTVEVENVGSKRVRYDIIMGFA